VDPKTYRQWERIQETNWWFGARRDLMVYFIPRGADKKLRPGILDVGCGSGGNLLLFSKIGKAVGIDNSETAVSVCKKKGLEAILGTATSLKFRANYFDVVVLADILEHLDNPQKAVAESFRVLKRGGTLIATVPAYNWLYSYHDLANGHKKRYSKNELMELFGGRYIQRISYLFSFALLPVIIMRSLNQITAKKEVDDSSVPPVINGLLSSLSKIELDLIKKGVSLPMGTSIFCVVRK